MSDAIDIRGAAEHNLRAVDVRIPWGSFTVVTGVSGSGKSSLAFDTIFREEGDGAGADDGGQERSGTDESDDCEGSDGATCECDADT